MALRPVSALDQEEHMAAASDCQLACSGSQQPLAHPVTMPVLVAAYLGQVPATSFNLQAAQKLTLQHVCMHSRSMHLCMVVWMEWICRSHCLQHWAVP